VLACLDFPFSYAKCVMWICICKTKITYLVKSWKCFYDYRISSLSPYYICHIALYLLSHIDVKHWSLILIFISLIAITLKWYSYQYINILLNLL
jgi:hypothetical protein